MSATATDPIPNPPSAGPVVEPGSNPSGLPRPCRRRGRTQEISPMNPLTACENASTSDLDPSAWIDRRATAQATRAAEARHASERRRLVDPTTCERDYSRDEIEFMAAMQHYKKKSGRMFPTWSEILEVLHSLGYRKSEPDATTSGPVGPT
jgi:hypothetical protein